jgi:hypothetical protein
LIMIERHSSRCLGVIASWQIAHRIPTCKALSICALYNRQIATLGCAHRTSHSIAMVAQSPPCQYLQPQLVHLSQLSDCEVIKQRGRIENRYDSTPHYTPRKGSYKSHERECRRGFHLGFCRGTDSGVRSVVAAGLKISKELNLATSSTA